MGTLLKDERFARLLQAAPKTTSRWSSIVDDLESTIQDLVASDALAHASIARAMGSQPAIPSGGYIQLGFVLYWAKHPPQALQQILDKLPKLVQELWTLLSDVLVNLHPPTVTQQEYEYMLGHLKDAGVVDPTGQVLATGPFEGADVGWIWAYFNYLINLVDPADIAPFLPPGKQCNQAPIIKVPSSGRVTIALLGDWGTGKTSDSGGDYDPAMAVLQTAQQLQPDYVVHLGDVYYAGTEDRLPPGEEQQHLVGQWPAEWKGRSYTLNSNHEMYGGANGYFDIALGRSGGATPFTSQQGFSYFALSIGDVAVVGLDSAYYDPSSLYMDGGLGDRKNAPDQYDFLQAVAKDHKQLVLLSHHTAVNTAGTEPMPLWRDVTSVVSPKQIHSWVWGHVHLGLAYGQQSAIGKHEVKGYCAGHSAIPIGQAWGYQSGDGVIDWISQTPVGGNNYPNRVRNGFAVLTIENGVPSVELYDSGNTSPAWPPKP